MILPSFLTQLGYDAFPIVQKLNSISYIEKEGHIDHIQPWYDFRDIFEYLSCVEFARNQLLQLPTGRALGSINIVPARYNSASLVFFAQATFDNLAVWLNRIHNLGLKGNSISFYKSQIRPLLGIKNKHYEVILSEHNEFILKLNSYRMEWLHRLAGGAEVYSDKSPSEPDANISIQIPIDPVIPSLRSDSKKYLERVQNVQRKNGGKWLVPVSEFANEIADTTKTLTLKIAEVAVTFNGMV